MKIYFSAVNTRQRFEVMKKAGARNLLFSFWEIYSQPRVGAIFDEVKRLGFSIFLDSGAHTLQKGKKVDYDYFLKLYIDFVKKELENIDAYVELDIENVVGLEQVYEWTRRLESEIRVPPVVVWHRERGKRTWVEMCQKYPYVGFSGFVVDPSGGPEVDDETLKKFLLYARAKNVKVHGFGFTRFSKPYLMKFFHSVDSTSWLAASRFGVDPITRQRMNVTKENRYEVEVLVVKRILEFERKINAW